MKNPFKYYPYLLCLLIINYSCEFEIDYDFPEAEKIIVVNGLFCSDSLFSVKISKSYPSYDKDPLRYIYIENANVELYQNSIYVEDLTWIYEGKYKSTTLNPKVNDTLKIVIKVPGYEEVWAQSHLPEKVNLKVDTIYPVIIDQKEYMAAKLIIDDPPGNNYYYFTSQIVPMQYTSKLGTNLYDYWIEDSIIGNWSSLEQEIPNIFAFNDEGFNNQKHTFTVYSSPLYLTKNELTSYYSLYSITDDLYYYLKTLNNQTHTLQSNLTDINPVHSNITNGLGIFSGYHEYRDSVTFEGNNTESELYYGQVYFQNDTFGLNQIRHYYNEDEVESRLSIGSINVYFDSETNQVKQSGMNVIIDIKGSNDGTIFPGFYLLDFLNDNNEKVLYGKVMVPDTVGISYQTHIFSHGYIDVIRYNWDSYNKNYIINFTFDFITEDNDTIISNYEGPISRIKIN